MSVSLREESTGKSCFPLLSSLLRVEMGASGSHSGGKSQSAELCREGIPAADRQLEKQKAAEVAKAGPLTRGSLRSLDLPSK